MGSVHAHKYGFPFQQPSTSCSSCATTIVHKTINYLLYIIILRYIQECYNITYFADISNISSTLRRIRKRETLAIFFDFAKRLITIEREKEDKYLCVILSVSICVHIAYYRKYCKNFKHKICALPFTLMM